MPLTASGVISEPLDLAADLIAGLSAWQTWTGTANSTEAKARIHLQSVEVDALVRPVLVIRWDQLHIVRGGYARGMLQFLFESDISSEYRDGGDEANDYESAAFEHTNNVGAVLYEAVRASEGSGKLYIPEEGFHLVYGPGRPTLEQRNKGIEEYYQSIWQTPFGLASSP